MVKSIPKLCLIADCDAVDNHLSHALDILGNRPLWIMIRDKQADDLALQEILSKVLKLVYYHPNIKLSINGAETLLKDHPYLGLHLPRDRDWQTIRQQYPRCFMGGSLHHVFDTHRVKQSQLNYVTISPLFTTASHPDAEPMDKVVLKKILKRLSCQTVALGGINGDTITQAMAYNFDAYACIQGWQNDDSLTKMVSLLYGQ